MRASQIRQQHGFPISFFIRMASPSRVTAALLTKMFIRPNLSIACLNPLSPARIGNIHLNGEGFAAPRRDFAHQCGQLLFISRGHDELRTGLRQCQRRIATNSLRRASYHSYFALEAEHSI
jgi:hypothetical protein